MSTNSAPLSRYTPNGQAAVAWRRDAAVVMRGSIHATMSPAKTTASTPDAPMSSARRNAVNGTSSSVVLMTMAECARRSARYASAATAMPAAAPPRYDTSTVAVIDHGVMSSPRATDSAIAYTTSAVPSLVRLSALSFMNMRCGSRRPRAATAVASGGATAAPRRSPVCHGMPNSVAIQATAPADATTSSVDIGMM